MKLGLDVGGTNTDIVLLEDNDQILFKKKVLTTPDVITGVIHAMTAVWDAHASLFPQVRGVFIGSTFALNALLQAKALDPVAVLRVDSGTLESIPVAHGWALSVAGYIRYQASFSGGMECDGRAIGELDISVIRAQVLEWLDAGVQSFAISSPFSVLYPDQEKQVKEMITSIAPCAVVTASHEVGGIGVIARENAAICNSLLQRCFNAHFSKIQMVLKQFHLLCPLWISQNNGTTMHLAHAMQFPILTLSSGPTNSFVGAARLTGLKDAMVIDIGGTSTDLGILQEGYPIPAGRGTMIQGISLNFSMPDVRSIALGGGTIVDLTEGVSTQSVGCNLRMKAQCFGGSEITLTDLAVRCGVMQIPDAMAPSISDEIAEQYLIEAAGKICAMLEERPIFSTLPCILVGGGAGLFKSTYFGGRRIVIPPSFDVANALGAALGELSESIDSLLEGDGAESKIALLKSALHDRLVRQGAIPDTIRCISEIRTAFHYLPTACFRLQLTMAGRI